jgi:uncharacterized membrane protein
MNELTIILRWYGLFFILGFIGLGFGQYLFKNWFDKGYGLSKFLGLLIVGLPLWLLASLKIVPFSHDISLLFIVLASIVSIILIIKSKLKFNKYMLLEELLFLVIFTLWCAIRSTNSQIEGTEKFMNIAFMNVLNRADYLPPSDPWFSGGTINYYYLGHYLFTFVGKAGNIAMSYAYNLAMVTIISFAFIGSFSIINQLLNFKKKKWSIVAGLMGSALLCFGSNLHFLSKWLEALFAGQPFNYWFPDGTRIIPNVIDEFPAYSITLADLHGHYLGFPFVIIFVALALVSWKIGITTVKKMKFNLVISILLCSLYGINTWDFITINALFLILHGYQAITAKVKLKEKLFAFLTSEITLLLPGLLFMLPYFTNFNPAVGGIGIVPLTTPRSLSAWLLMWGAFLLISLFSLLTIIIIHRLTKTSFWQSIKEAIKLNSNIIFALLLNLLVFGLIIGVEIFFVKDIFEKDNGVYFRANTVFKFYFSAWTIWSIIIAYYAGKTLQKIFTTPLKKWGFALFGINVVLIAVIFVGTVSYIFEGVNDFYKFFKYENGLNVKVAEIFENKEKIVLYDTLDGNDYIKDQYAEDYAGITWLNQNIKGQAIIAEAVGEAYTYFSRVSANTGLVTPIGWPTHEWQWRDNATEVFKRKDEIEKLYTTTNIDDMLSIIDKYKIEYIFVGIKEREYKDLNTDLFDKYLEKVFISGKTFIYKVG